MLQPVGGMDRIAYGFAEKLGNLAHFRCVVKKSAGRRTGPRSVFIGGRGGPQHRRRLLHLHVCRSRSCATFRRLLECRAKQAIHRNADDEPVQNRVAIAPLLGAGVQHLRRHFFPEPDGRPGLVSQRPTVLLPRRFDFRIQLRNGRRRSPHGLSRLGSTAAKLAASRASVEKLHPGHGKHLTQPIYISWPSIPYSLGCLPTPTWKSRSRLTSNCSSQRATSSLRAII